MRYRFKGALLGALAAGVLATPAQAAVTTPGAAIEAFHSRDFVGVNYPNQPNTELTVSVERNGVELATVTRDTDNEGLIEINHDGGQPGAEGDCFAGGVAPDLRPGDVIRVTDGDTIDDTMIVQNLTLTWTAAADGTGVLSGIALDATTGEPLDVVAVQLRNGGDRPEASVVPNADGTWEVTNFDHDEDGTLDGPVQFNAYPDASAEWVNGAEEAASELTVAENADGGLCTPAPENRIVGNPNPQIVNGNTPGPVIIQGVMLDGVTAESNLGTVVNSDGAFEVSIPVADLAEGVNTVTITFSDGTTAETTVNKDTVAPAAPTITPNGGVVPQSVSINGGIGNTVHYTLDGTDPSATNGSSLNGQLNVTGPVTLKAVSIDAAGNVSPVSTATFTAPVTPPANNGGNNNGGGAAPVVTPPVVIVNPPVTGGQPGPNPPGANDPFLVSNIKAAKKIKLKRAKRLGLRVALTAPEETDTLRIVVRRNGKIRKTVNVAAQPGRAVFRVKVARTGRWSLTIRPVDEGRRGLAQTVRFRVVK